MFNSSVCLDADEDLNGTIDNEELKKCLRAFEFDISDEEIDDLLGYCDIEKEGIQFKEFIVFLCLVYLLTDAPNSPNLVQASIHFFFFVLIPDFLLTRALLISCCSLLSELAAEVEDECTSD